MMGERGLSPAPPIVGLHHVGGLRQRRLDQPRLEYGLSPGFDPVLDLEDVSALIGVLLRHDQRLRRRAAPDHTGAGTIRPAHR